jgi:hypothetical protein
MPVQVWVELGLVNFNKYLDKAFEFIYDSFTFRIFKSKPGIFYSISSLFELLDHLWGRNGFDGDRETQAAYRASCLLVNPTGLKHNRR